MIRFCKIRCQSCGSDTCTRKPIGSWCSDTEGCTKLVSELDGDKYFHYIVEVKPQLLVMLQNGKFNHRMWIEMEEFIHTIENKPAGERFKR